jgi:hypothetical protein
MQEVAFGGLLALLAFGGTECGSPPNIESTGAQRVALAAKASVCCLCWCAYDSCLWVLWWLVLANQRVALVALVAKVISSCFWVTLELVQCAQQSVERNRVWCCFTAVHACQLFASTWTLLHLILWDLCSLRMPHIFVVFADYACRLTRFSARHAKHMQSQPGPAATQMQQALPCQILNWKMRASQTSHQQQSLQPVPAAKRRKRVRRQQGSNWGPRAG